MMLFFCCDSLVLKFNSVGGDINIHEFDGRNWGDLKLKRIKLNRISPVISPVFLVMSWNEEPNNDLRKLEMSASASVVISFCIKIM